MFCVLDQDPKVEVAKSQHSAERQIKEEKYGCREEENNAKKKK